jgi:hypothetical protein
MPDQWDAQESHQRNENRIVCVAKKEKVAMKKYRAALVVLLGFGLAFSQSAVLDKHTSGVEFGASVTGQTDKSYVGLAHIGYSFLGVFDAELSIGPGKTLQNKDSVGSGLRYLAFSPSLAIFFLKQGEHVPLSIALNASYESDAYFSDSLNQNNLQLDGSVYSIGATAFRKFELSKKISLLANVGVKYCLERDVLGDDYGVVSYTDNGFPAANVGCDFLFKRISNNLIKVGVGIGYDNRANQNNVSATATLGVVIPWTNRIIGRYYPRRYIVVPEDAIEQRPQPAQVQPEVAPSDIVTINVPDSKGGYVAVKLVKTKDGYIGPQGEFYPGRPTIDQLKALYGE